MRLAGTLLAVTLVAGIARADKTEAPKPQPASHAGVGKLAPDLSAKAIDGTEFKLSSAMKGKKAGVVVVTSVTCPLSKKYLPTVAALEKEFAAKGVAFVLIDAVKTDKVEEMKKLAGDAGVKAPFVHDADGTLCKQLGATSTTDVFVFDATRTVKYRGAIDDQYGLGYSKESPKHTYAKSAIEAVLAGTEPAVHATTAPGCELDLADVKVAAAAPTYHNFASRLIQQNCQECHRKGGIGPFALESLDDVKAHKGMVRKVVKDDTMPVWHAAPSEKAGEARTFKNDRSLPAADKAAFLAWLADGTPEGDKADAPLTRSFADGEWAIGKPDLVVQIPKPIDIPATGVMKYQYAKVDLELKEDKWVQATEVLPTDRSVVHHVLVFAVAEDGTPIARRIDEQGYYAAYVPGNGKQVQPAGFAKKLPKGATIVFQIHYTPNGTATKDQVKVGFKFADAPPAHEVGVKGIAPPRTLLSPKPKLEIPKNDPNYKTTADWKLREDAVITAFSPHMHVRGKAARYEAVTADPKTGAETVTLLLDVPHYDFNWQLRYELAEPVRLPAGTTVRYTAWYDNSSGNPHNPDPNKDVRWGDQTYDEMMLGYAEWYNPKAVVKGEKKDEKK